jgi:hypothetical protein
MKLPLQTTAARKKAVFGALGFLIAWRIVSVVLLLRIYNCVENNRDCSVVFIDRIGMFIRVTNWVALVAVGILVLVLLLYIVESRQSKDDR